MKMVLKLHTHRTFPTTNKGNLDMPTLSDLSNGHPAKPTKTPHRRRWISSTSTLSSYDDDVDHNTAESSNEIANPLFTIDQLPNQQETSAGCPTGKKANGLAWPMPRALFQIDKEAARKKAQSTDHHASDKLLPPPEPVCWHPELDGGVPPWNPSWADRAVREMAWKISRTESDEERLPVACRIAVTRFDCAESVSHAAEAIYMYEQFRPFKIPLSPEKVSEALANAQKHFVGVKTAHRLGMVSPAKLREKVRRQGPNWLIPGVLSRAEFAVLGGRKTP
jgi:hypothetical protein